MQHTTAEEDSQFAAKRVACKDGNKIHYRYKPRKNSLDEYSIKGNKKKAVRVKNN